MLRPGAIQSLTIEKPAAGGRMIARLGGRVVLVSGAIPGERVTARIERVTKAVVYAQATTIDEASPDRRAAAVDMECGGALYRHIAYERQLAIKRDVIVDAFGRLGRLTLPAPPPVAASREDGYRMRARLHVRGRRVGFFREATHDLCDVRQTQQLLSASCDVLDRVTTTLQSLGVDGVREIELSENVDASDRAMALDLDAPLDTRVVDRLAAIDGVTGLVSHAGARGRAHVTDRLQIDGVDVSLQRHVLAFFQGNRYLLRDLVAHVVSQLHGGSVVDLYAGVGLFAVAAARTRGLTVTAVEGDRHGAADLAANATASSVQAVHDSVETFVQSVRLQPDEVRTVIVDPPRTGLSRDALDGVVAIGASRVVYVSCDVATLARDARRMVDGGYDISRADAFDLFPNTPHVETVVVFDRR